MAEQTRNAIVGLVGIVGIMILCGLIAAFGGGRSLFRNSYDIKVHFEKGVLGVQAGQGVTLNGKRIGETVAVEFYDNDDLSRGVNVTVAVDAKYELPQAAEVVVPENIMGIGKPVIQLVVLDPDDPGRLPRDGTGKIPGRMESITDKVLGPGVVEDIETAVVHMSDLAAALKPVADEFARLLEARELGDVDVNKMAANLDTVIQRFDTALKNLNFLLGDETNRANFAAALANLNTMAAAGVQALEDVSGMAVEGKSAMADARGLFASLAGTTDDLSSLLKSMDKTLVAVNDGDGTAGLMLNDNRLYEEMVVATKRLTKTLDDLRELIEQIKSGNLTVKMR